MALGALGAAILALTSCAEAPPVKDAAAKNSQVARYSTWGTPIGVLIADPAARAVLDTYIPQFSQGPMVNMARTMTFRAIQGYAPAVMTEERLAGIDKDLAKLTPIPPPAWAANLKMPNFEESKVPPYVLPDVLTLANGKRVHDAATWWNQRRPEVLNLYETQVYGRAPGRPTEERFEVFDAGTPALDGHAIRKQVMIHLSDKAEAPTIQLVEYLPAAAHGRVPVFLMLNFGLPVADPGVRTPMVWDQKTGRRVPAAPRPAAATSGMSGLAEIPITRYLDAGIGVAAINYTDVDPDFQGGYAFGIRGFLAGPNEADRAPDAWGALAAWSWSLSRVQDYLETDSAVDAKRVAIYGASRTGKSALWAAARDQRFAAVVACCSGEIGASLLRRNFGKSFAVAAGPGDAAFWTARNFAQYYGHPDQLPVDSHMLLALIAPRPVLLQTGSQDLGGDPKGEFLAEIAASPVYKLLGAQGLGNTQWPPREPIIGDLGYVMHDGGHGVTAGDWEVYLAFLKRHLHP